MVYGFCVEVLKASDEYKFLKERFTNLDDRDLYSSVLRRLGIKYNIDYYYDVNVRVKGCHDLYYVTDVISGHDVKTVDLTDDVVIDTLDKDSLDALHIAYYPIQTCGWSGFYGNEKDYDFLRPYTIEELMTGGAKCRGD